MLDFGQKDRDVLNENARMECKSDVRSNCQGLPDFWNPRTSPNKYQDYSASENWIRIRRKKYWHVLLYWLQGSWFKFMDLRKLVWRASSYSCWDLSNIWNCLIIYHVVNTWEFGNETGISLYVIESKMWQHLYSDDNKLYLL